MKSSMKGFTLIEILIAFVAIFLLSKLIIPFDQHHDCSNSLRTREIRALHLKTACEVYKETTKKPIEGKPAKPMTRERANELFTQMEYPKEFLYEKTDRPLFPDGWGETAPGVFDPIR